MAKELKLFMQLGSTMVRTKNVKYVDQLLGLRMKEISVALKKGETYKMQVPPEAFKFIKSELIRYDKKAPTHANIDIIFAINGRFPLVTISEGSEYCLDDILKPKQEGVETVDNVEQQNNQTENGNVQG